MAGGQSVTSRSREFLFPGILQFFLWYRNRSRKNLVPKKVSEPVSKKFGTEKSLGTGLEKFWYRKKSRNRSRKILVPKKNIETSLKIFQNISVDLGPGLVPFPGFLQFFDGIGTGLEKKLVPKKVSKLVSKKFGTEKRYLNQPRNFSEYLC